MNPADFTTNELIESIAGITEKMDQLEDERNEIAGLLEDAARVYEKQGGKSLSNPSFSSLNCTSCYLVYSGPTSDSIVARQFNGTLFDPEPHVHFYADCSWCGQGGAGVGVDVPVSFIDKYLKDKE